MLEPVATSTELAGLCSTMHTFVGTTLVVGHLMNMNVFVCSKYCVFPKKYSAGGTGCSERYVNSSGLGKS